MRLYTLKVVASVSGAALKGDNVFISCGRVYPRGYILVCIYSLEVLLILEKCNRCTCDNCTNERLNIELIMTVKVKNHAKNLVRGICL